MKSQNDRGLQFTNTPSKPVSKESSKPTPLPASTLMIRDELEKRSDRDFRDRSRVDLGEEPELQRLPVH